MMEYYSLFTNRYSNSEYYSVVDSLFKISVSMQINVNLKSTLTCFFFTETNSDIAKIVTSRKDPKAVIITCIELHVAWRKGKEYIIYGCNRNIIQEAG